MNGPIFLTHKLEVESTLRGEIDGVAYSGQPIANYMWYKNLIVDIATLKVAKSTTPILRDHQPSQVAGKGVVSIENNQVLIKGNLSKKSSYGREIIDLSEDGIEWEMSLGVFDGVVEEVTDVEINGVHIAHGFVLKNGILREVSVVILGADMNTQAKVFSNEKGDMKPMLTKEQWVKFACACGGNKETTPEELEKKFQEMTDSQKEEVAAKEAEIEAKQAEIDELKSEIAKIKEDAAVEEREENIQAAVKEKAITFSSEKIKAAAKTQEATDMLLSLIADMKAPGKIDKKFAQKQDLGDGGATPKTPEEIRLAAKKMVSEGKAKDVIQAISILEAK